MKFEYYWTLNDYYDLIKSDMPDVASYMIDYKIIYYSGLIEWAIYLKINWYDFMKFMHSLDINDKDKRINNLQKNIKDNVDELVGHGYTSHNKIINWNNEYIRDCFNEFVNCIQREWNDNPLFDENVLKYEIEQYYGIVKDIIIKDNGYSGSK